MAPDDPNTPSSTAACSVSCNPLDVAATHTLQSQEASTKCPTERDISSLSTQASGLKEAETKARAASRHQVTFHRCILFKYLISDHISGHLGFRQFKVLKYKCPIVTVK